MRLIVVAVLAAAVIPVVAVATDPAEKPPSLILFSLGVESIELTTTYGSTFETLMK